MINPIKKWLAAPRFTGDERKSAQASAMNTAANYYLVALLAGIGVYVPFFARYKLESLLVIGLLLILLLVARSQLVRGRLTFASIFLIASGWAVCELLAWVGGGIFSPLMFSLAVITIVISMFFPSWVGNLFLALSCGLGLLFALIQQFGPGLPQVFTYSPLAAWFYFSVPLLFINRMMDLTVRRLEGALNLAQQQGRARQEAETILRSNEEKYRDLVENIRDVMFSVNPEGYITYMSPQVSDFGYHPADFQSRHFSTVVSEFIHPEDHLKAVELFQDHDLHLSQEPPAIVFRVRTRDGQIRWVEETARRHGELGSATITGVLRDVTSQIEADRAARIISEVQLALLQPGEIVDIFALLARKVQELIGDCVTAASLLNDADQTARGVAYAGLEVPAEEIFRIFGRNLLERSYPLANLRPDVLRLYESGKLERLEDGLHALLSSVAPRVLCSAVESFLHVRDVYAIGFSHNGEHLGALVILTRSDPAPYKNVVEQIVNLAALAISRRRAEDALRKTQSLLNDTEILGNTGGWEIDQAARILTWTETVYRIHEVDAAFRPNLERALGFYHPDSRPVLERALMRAIDQAEPFDLELTLITARGNRRCVHVIGKPDPDHRRIFGFVQDITERKRTEERVQQSEITYRGILDSLDEAVYILDETGTFIDVNYGAERMYGYSRAELVGRSPVTVSAEDMNDLPRVVQQVQLAFQGTHQAMEFWGKRKSGQVFPKEVHLYPGTYFGRQVVVAIAQDITARKRAEEALQSSESRFRALIEQAPLAINLTRDMQGLYANPKFVQTFGLQNAADFVGSRISQFSSPEAMDLIGQRLQRRSDGLDNPPAVETMGLRQDGSRIPVEVSIAHVQLADGPATLAFVTDITARKADEAKIRATLEEKEALLREVHHRVKNNLQVIIALIKMRSRALADAEAKQFLMELEGQARTMSLVYEQLYQAENLSQVGMAAYLRQLTTHVLDIFGQREFAALRIDAPIVLDVSQAMPCGLIVNELFTNILKHAFPPGFAGSPEVSVSLRCEGQACRLTVQDNGVGLPPGVDFEAGQTLGLRLVNLWATHQLGGALEITRQAGTCFQIDFELK